VSDKTQDPYQDGTVPEDADFQPDGSDVASALPGGSRLDEGEDDPGLDADDIRPSSGTAP
jgi:hypothetical protein